MVEEKYKFPFQKKHKRIIKAQAKTNLNYGKSPKERSVKELLANGFVILD
jgi:hypothetical protein